MQGKWHLFFRPFKGIVSEKMLCFVGNNKEIDVLKNMFLNILSLWWTTSKHFMDLN